MLLGGEDGVLTFVNRRVARRVVLCFWERVSRP